MPQPESHIVAQYNVEVTPDGDGFVARVPELEGCVTEGDSLEEALDNVKDAIKVWLEADRSREIDRIIGKKKL